METLEQLRQDLTDTRTAITHIANGTNRIIALVESLQAQVGSGGVVTQQQLDELGATAFDIKQAAEGVQGQQDLIT